MYWGHKNKKKKANFLVFFILTGGESGMRGSTQKNVPPPMPPLTRSILEELTVLPLPMKPFHVLNETVTFIGTNHGKSNKSKLFFTCTSLMFNFLFREAVYSEVHVVYREISSTLWRHTIDKETLPYTVWTLHSIMTAGKKLMCHPYLKHLITQQCPILCGVCTP